MSLIHAPVVTGNKDLILEYYSHCFFNPTNFVPRLDFTERIQVISEFFSDSGGYQIYSINQNRIDGFTEKQCVVIPGVRTRNSVKHLIIDPIDICRKYGKLNIVYGFTLDYPLSDNSTEKEYSYKLEKSYTWAKLMFRYRHDLCPNTNLLIPLHYISKDQLHAYYNKMSSLKPNGYAFPVRGRDSFKGYIWIVCSLCFLHHKGVDQVHMFGSARPEIIIIGAAAIGLNMFKQLSFDARTWNTVSFNSGIVYYFDPETLKRKSIQKDTYIDILMPNHLLKRINRKEVPLTKTFKKRIIMLHNVLAIDHYTRKMVARSKNIDDLKRFIATQSNFSQKKQDRLIMAIKILEESKKKGYGFIEKWLQWIW